MGCSRAQDGELLGWIGKLQVHGGEEGWVYNEATMKENGEVQLDSKEVVEKQRERATGMGLQSQKGCKQKSNKLSKFKQK